MEQSYTGRRTLLPKPQPRELGSQPLSAQPLAASLSTSTNPVQPASRQPKSSPKTDQEWEHQRPNIEQLYVTDDLSLPEVMREMEGKYHFKASRKQYNNKISQWRIGKNVKTNEMRAIVRKIRERRMEDQPKASVFRVRSRPVDPDKIERFIKDKGIGEDVVMADAATPSDISCITPQPSNSEITGQSSPSLFEGSSVNRFSPVEPTPSSASYQPILSSDSLVMSINPALCQLDVGQQSPFHAPNPSHRFPPSSPHLSRHSPVDRRWSLSPLLDTAQTSRSPLSPYVGHPAKSNLTDPFLHHIAVEPAVSTFEWASAFASYSNRSRPSPRTTLGNYIADLVRGLIPQLHTYEGQKEHEGLESKWSTIKYHLGVAGHRCDDCDHCKAYDAAEQLDRFMHLQNVHPEILPYNIDQDFPISLVETNDTVGLDLGQRATAHLFESGRHRDGERLARVIIQEMERQTSLDINIKGSVTLEIAEIFTAYGRHEKAEQLVQGVLKGDFGAIARMVAGGICLEVWTFEGEIQDISWRDGPKLTDEEFEDIYAMLGEERAPKMPVYFKALSVLSKLDAHHVEEVVMDEEEVMDEREATVETL